MKLQRVDVRFFDQHGLFIAAIFILALFTFNQIQAQASPLSWLDGEPELIGSRPFNSEMDPPRWVNSSCSMQQVAVVDPGRSQSPISDRLCVSQGKSFRIGQGSSGSSYTYISIGFDKLFYRVNIGSNHAHTHHVVGTDTVVVAVHSANESKLIFVHNNFHNELAKLNNSYDFNYDAETIPIGGSRFIRAYGWGMSNNGRYLVYGSGNGVNQYNYLDNMMRADLETGEVKSFGKAVAMHLYRPDSPNGAAISNDGKRVAVTGIGLIKFWDVSEDCLIDPPNREMHGSDACPSRIYNPPYHNLLSNYPWSDQIKVDDNLETLTYAYDGSGFGEPFIYTLRMPGLSDGRSLDYLAMGDSYSSGEGDIVAGRAYHYIYDTGGKGGCHLSSRSYPFMLQQWWSVDLRRMQSIACSGASVIHDYISSLGYYAGQHEQLKRAGDERQAAIDDALNNFTPGVVPQIEFVRKYKPKVVTLTGGGNDVGFGSILSYCASPTLRLGVWVDDTCRYARDSRAEQELINSIHNQYGIMKMAVSKIKNTSPNTKIYIIGYPQFIADPTISCLYNAASLNTSERRMIRSMVAELNDVLWRAARDSGAEFIDIEDSLEGGQLCQGSKYVTGLHDLGVSRLTDSDVDNAFHPNANGHIRMAREIYNQIPNFEQAAQPLPRSALPGDQYESSKVAMIFKMASDILQVATNMTLRLDSATLQPGSKVSLAIHSDPAHLGEFTVDDTGGLSISLPLPDEIAPGRHALVAEGLSFSGEPITLSQFITVTSNDPSDADGDGIPDSQDSCLFITEWHDESTGENICKPSSLASSSSARPGNREGDRLNDANLAPTGDSLLAAKLAGLIMMIFGLISVLLIWREYEYSGKVKKHQI